MLSKVLVLIMGLAVPVINAKGTKDVLGTVGQFGFSAIPDELVHCSA